MNKDNNENKKIAKTDILRINYMENRQIVNRHDESNGNYEDSEVPEFTIEQELKMIEYVFENYAYGGIHYSDEEIMKIGTALAKNRSLVFNAAISTNKIEERIVDVMDNSTKEGYLENTLIQNVDEDRIVGIDQFGRQF